jgi:hypothetical protein
MRTQSLESVRWQTLYLAMRSRLSGSAFRLLLVMLRCVDETTWQDRGVLIAWPSFAEILVESGLSQCSITRGREELVAARILSRAPGCRRGGCDPVAIYRIKPARREHGRSACGCQGLPQATAERHPDQARPAARAAGADRARETCPRGQITGGKSGEFR